MPVGHSGQRRLHEVVGSIEADQGFPAKSGFLNKRLKRKLASTSTKFKYRRKFSDLNNWK
jgi:hypothetical protein